MDTCRVEDCTRTDLYKVHTLCHLHYQRWRKTGSPTGIRTRSDGPSSRFWAKVNKTETCWLWTRGTDGKGYGKFQAGTSRATACAMLAHVYAYETVIGPVPVGLELDHLCRNPLCVNPAHLEPVTHAENIWRGRFGDYVRTIASKADCKHGHPLSGGNLIITRSGHRRCRACKNAAETRRYRRNRDRLSDSAPAGAPAVVQVSE